jgi:hypothetical protein
MQAFTSKIFDVNELLIYPSHQPLMMESGIETLEIFSMLAWLIAWKSLLLTAKSKYGLLFYANYADFES